MSQIKSDMNGTDIALILIHGRSIDKICGEVVAQGKATQAYCMYVKEP